MKTPSETSRSEQKRREGSDVPQTEGDGIRAVECAYSRPRLMTVPEASKFLRCGKTTLYNFIKRGLPFYKIAGSTRFSEDDLVQFIGSNRVTHR
jgi:excisionase family DNA binding protein